MRTEIPEVDAPVTPSKPCSSSTDAPRKTAFQSHKHTEVVQCAMLPGRVTPLGSRVSQELTSARVGQCDAIEDGCSTGAGGNAAPVFRITSWAPIASGTSASASTCRSPCSPPSDATTRPPVTLQPSSPASPDARTARRSEDSPPSRRRDCHFADIPSPSLLKNLLKVEGGAAE